MVGRRTRAVLPAFRDWWGGSHTALTAAHCSGVTPRAIKILPPLLPLLRSPWARGASLGTRQPEPDAFGLCYVPVSSL